MSSIDHCTLLKLKTMERITQTYLHVREILNLSLSSLSRGIGSPADSSHSSIHIPLQHAHFDCDAETKSTANNKVSYIPARCEVVHFLMS